MPSPTPSPTIPGFSPDPSICLIDGTYLLVTSSFHLFPGHAVHRTDQLSLLHSDTELPTSKSNTIATGGLWAPTIRHHAGITYIVCTNVVYTNGRTDSCRRNFFIRSTDPDLRQWSDPLYFDFDGIDPSLFFDFDGRSYIQICAHPRGGIWQFEIDPNTAQQLSPPKLLWEGWDRRFTEGPHIYKKDGFYYLLVAEGGTFEDHMISIARSDSIHGPFEACPSNPFLTAAGTQDSLHHVGHGDFFQDKDGSWWTVFLGVRRSGNRYPLGRETFLTRVDWPEGDWPTIRPPSSIDCVTKVKPSMPSNNTYVHLRDADLSKYIFGDRQLVLSASPTDLSSHKDTLTLAGRRQLRLEGSSSATLAGQHTTRGPLKAGLCVYKDEHRFAAVGFDFSRAQVYFEARNRATGYSAEGSVTIVSQDRVRFRIQYTRFAWTFLYSIGESAEWTALGVVDTLQLSGRDFTGPIFGVFAVGSEECEGVRVRFEDVEL
ncbi:putative xylosidase/arabinosidase [Plectosphaerella plurivora]|uniref:Xylosidase/arabinosidase n=1 Tax=Plectosphaerella plurivora TaxID=936078 RepID=A0A9P8VDD2_9PEZI|nr:putative xylosidase/arabinosidase [Plectosphaerella plurivora]